MMMDTSTLIGLVSIAVTLLVAVFEAGVAVGRHREKFERMSRQLDDEEHKDKNKNDRR